MATKSCPSCGHGNPDEFRFCEQCGSRLPERPPQLRRPKLRRPKPPAWVPWVILVVLIVAGAYWLGSQRERGTPEGGTGTGGGTEGGVVGTWATYANQAHGFSLEYPASWNQRSFAGEAIVVFDHPSIPGIISVGVDQLGETFESYIESYKQNLSQEEIEVLHEEDALIRGLQARVFEERGETTWGFMKGLVALIKSNGQVFSISGLIREDAYPAHKPIFEHVINNFRLTG